MEHRHLSRDLKSWRLLAVVVGALAAQSLAAQGVIKGDPAKGQQIATQVCAACHAADGNSAIPVNPSLAGQHPEYTYKQLVNFKPQGGKPAERNNAVMAGMVANLSDDDMKNLAAYFASQKAKPGRGAGCQSGQAGRSHLPRRCRRQGCSGLRFLPLTQRRRHASAVSAARWSTCRLHLGPAESLPRRTTRQRCRADDAGRGGKNERPGNCRRVRVHRRPALIFSLLIQF